MVGNVAQLAADLAEAFSVKHDGKSKRVDVTQAIATAISDYLEKVTVVGSTCNGVCPYTTITHITLDVEGSLE